MFKPKYLDITNPTEEIIIDDEKCLIVDIPMLNIHSRQKEIKKLCEDNGVEKNETISGQLITYGAFYNECLMIQQSIRRSDSVSFSKDSKNYGQPYWVNIKDYISSVGSMHNEYFNKVIDFRNSIIKPLDEIGVDELSEILEGVLSSDTMKKKRSVDLVNGFALDTVMKFLDISVKELAKCRKENLVTSLQSIKQEKSKAKQKAK